MFRFFQNNPQIHRLDKNTPKPPSQGGVRGSVSNGGPQSARQRELDGLDDFEDDLSDIEGELEGGEDLEEVSIDLADEARLLLDSLWRKNQDTSKLMVCVGLDSSMQPLQSLPLCSPPPPPGTHTGGVCTGGVRHPAGPQADQAHSGGWVDLQSDYTGMYSMSCVCVLKCMWACAVVNCDFLSLSTHYSIWRI